jgi:excinuclease UvrABC helicase subunit UvrB
MSQKLQDEEESQEGEMDEGIQEACWEGACRGKEYEFCIVSWLHVCKGECLRLHRVSFSSCMQDSTFELERRRNRPEKYNREIVAKTLTAIKKIDKIRARRQERFYEQRMKIAKVVSKKVAKQELEKQVHLVRAPESLLQKEKEKKRVIENNDVVLQRDVEMAD